MQQMRKEGASYGQIGAYFGIADKPVVKKWITNQGQKKIDINKINKRLEQKERKLLEPPRVKRVKPKPPMREFTLEKKRIDRVQKIVPCPNCGEMAPRLNLCMREIRDIDAVIGLTYTMHKCPKCGKRFSSGDDIAPLGVRHTIALEQAARRMREEGYSHAAIGAYFGINWHTVYAWLSRKDRRKGPLTFSVKRQ
jgi:predicted RNA-binding Zn-ribbon protein involved in translation (DUF1610 family)